MMGLPASEATTSAIEGILFGHPSLNIYAVIDGSAVPQLRTRIARSGCLSACLNRGELAPEVAAASPWLVQLDRDTPLTGWFLREGWGQGWGILALSPADIATMRRHFRSVLVVTLPDGRLVQFRWYDPRVLRAYLPTCTGEEAAIMFGPAQQYFTEGDDSNLLLQFTRAEHGVSATPLTLPG
jgi:hypothetical protein